MRETRLSGSEGGAGSSPVPTPIVAWAFQPMSGRPRIAPGGWRRVGRQEAQKTQKTPTIRALEIFSRYHWARNVVSGGDEPNYRHFSSLRSRAGNRV